MSHQNASRLSRCCGVVDSSSRSFLLWGSLCPKWRILWSKDSQTEQMDSLAKSSSVNPFVYWAQSNEQVFLRVELEAKGPPEVVLSAKTFKFSCDGIAPGHRDTQHFAFTIDLHDEVVPGQDGYRMDIGGSSVQFFLDKTTEGFWPALLKTRNKPAW